MIWLFEDDERDYKSKLLSFNLGDSTNVRFMRGAGCVVSAVPDIIKEDDVVAVIDLPVYNDHARRNYYKLKITVSDYDNRLLCLPIPCVEYYFIRSVKDEVLVTNKDEVSTVREYGFYNKFGVTYDSFEQFCKHVIASGFVRCVTEKKKHEDRCFYFGENCSIPDCGVNLGLAEKTYMVAKEFPALPEDFGWKDLFQYNYDYLYNKHVELVNLYNSTCDAFQKVQSDFYFKKVGVSTGGNGMSLTIGWLGEYKDDYYKDVEMLFNQVELEDTPEVRKVLQLIEKAEYSDPLSVIDRFGVKLYTSDISTGCKAALSGLLGNWDKPVSLLEVGNDACSAIVSLCKNNHILLRSGSTSFTWYSDEIDVICDGKHFINHDSLYLYLKESGRD